MGYSDIMDTENRFMEQIYGAFEHEIRKLNNNKRRTADYYDSGAYEDQDAFTAAGAKSTASREAYMKEKQYAGIYDRPYFAHLTLNTSDGLSEDELDIFLSDNEKLDSAIQISDNPEVTIFPFKQDSERPFFSAAYSCYQAKSGKQFTVKGNDHSLFVYQPSVIRDVDVFKRRIQSIVCHFPIADSDEYIDADELLNQRLNDNRNNAELRNIIATLQLKQFGIIQTDIKSNFVVQGCAGSGKTQCLIHRLFFLRASINSDIGWEKVLLITPSELFRNYSSLLMRRYRLESINNTSLPEFYKHLLEIYDPRFANRQYVFELTEEYLPDMYLNQVYSIENITAIERKIDETIMEHISDGCHFLNISVPPKEQIDISFVDQLAESLDKLLQNFDKEEETLLADTEYQDCQNKAEALEKKLAICEKKKGDYISRAEKFKEEKRSFETLSESLTLAESDLSKLKSERNNRISTIILELHEYASSIKRNTTLQLCIDAMGKFAEICEKIDDIYVPQSNDAEFEEEYLQLLDDLYHEEEQAILAFTGGLKPERWWNKHRRAVDENNLQIAKVTQEINDIQIELDEIKEQMQKYGIDNVSGNRKKYRSELSKTQNYLSRIESSMFEQEVWNALSPLKSQYGIKTLDYITADNGAKRQYRILYKSDLLFYLFIYSRLYSNRVLPEISFICIDEGQDLHQADYTLLRRLFPSATYNVFGDTSQVLHSACGISDWTTETGIPTVFELIDNYRNTPAIVDFCNKQFNSNMAYLGNIDDEMLPQIVRHTEDDIVTAIDKAKVVIIKDNKTFEVLCSKVPSIVSQLDYIDTKSSVLHESKIPCYSIFAAKGLEFPEVFVFSNGMTDNQKLVACTRAMKNLYYYESEE